MNRLLCTFLLFKRLQSFNMRRIGMGLLMTLIVLWPLPMIAPNGSMLRAHLVDQVRAFQEQQIPSILRSLGIIPQPPEYIAQQVLFALDRHDLAGITRFVGSDVSPAHTQMNTILRSWPEDMLRQPGCWGRIGPYYQDRWHTRVPTGSIRRIPLTLSSSQETHELILLFQFDGQNWRIASAQHQRLSGAKPDVTVAQSSGYATLRASE